MAVGRSASSSLALAAVVYEWNVVQNGKKVVVLISVLFVDRKKSYELKRRMNKCMSYYMST